MDSTNENVHKIKSSLLTSRRRLHVLDKKKDETLPSHGKTIQSALKNADFQADTVHHQISTFVLELENIDNASSLVNLHPQMAWMYSQLGIINQDLELADQHVTDAMTFTDKQCYSLIDIKNEVNRENVKLKAYEEKVKNLKAQTKQEVEQVKKRAASAKASIQSNEKEIETKQSAISGLEQRATQLKSEIATKQNETANANKNRKESRNWAVGTGVTTGLLLAAAPFTFGITAIGAVATATAMGVTIDDTLDHKKRVKQLRASINEAENENKSLVQAVSNHKTETARLKRDIESYQTDIKAKEVELKDLEQRIHTCSQAMEKMSSIGDYAASTLTNLRLAVPDLQHVRNALERCSDLLREKSVEVKDSAGLAHRLAEHIPVIGTKIKRRNDYRKQMLVIGEVLTTLGNFRRALPSLLPGKSLNLLDIKPWNSVNVCIADGKEDIPSVTLF